MLYCTKCQTVCEDSTHSCPNCKRSRGLRPIKGSDMVFFMKVREIEAAEIEEIFENNVIGCRIDPVSSGFATSMFDSEYLPSDKNIYVRYQDLERANEVLAAEREEAEPEEEVEPPSAKRIVMQSLAVITFMVFVMLLVFAANPIANALKNLLM